MRLLFALLIILVNLNAHSQPSKKTENVILVTFDGYRWQELFGGAQKKLLHTKKYVHDLKMIEQKYDDKDFVVRRQKLMPFLWQEMAVKGQIYGNKKLHNKMTLTNRFKFSYPGYNEIFSGWGDKRINSNDYPDNPNSNIFDFLSTQKGFEGKLFACGTWDAFPRIINVKRNKTAVYVDLKANENGTVKLPDLKYDSWITSIPGHNPYAQTDTLTYHFAKEYLQRNHPRLAFIGFDETDHYGHEGNYDAYLGSANTLDNYMKDLWDFIQSDPLYKDKTTLIITCDHGRGDIPKMEWKHHGHVLGAEYIWLAVMGPDIKALGEVATKEKLHQNQIAATICKLLGFDYKPDHFAGPPIQEIINK